MPDLTESAASTTEQPSTQDAGPEASEGERRLHILLAEDSPTNRLIATINLEQAGYLVQVVDNGRKAVQALDEKDFDLVLMDVHMPEMDGLEATRTIRRSEETSGRHVPIIAMTGTDTQEHRQECLEAGMDGFITKPVTQCELHEAIGLLLSQDRDGPGGGPQEAENPQPTLSVHLHEALKGVDDDVDLLRHVVEMFLEEYRSHMAALRDALARQDATSVEGAAYKLKRVLRNVGGLAACDLLHQLEGMGEKGELGDGRVVLEALEAEVARVVTFFSTPGWDKGLLTRGEE